MGPQKHRLLLVCAMVAICCALPKAQDNTKPLTNADVASMVRAGLPESTIVLAIQNSSVKFDTSPQALIELKKQGATQVVMNAMITAGGKNPASPGKIEPVARTEAPPAKLAAPVTPPPELTTAQAVMARVVEALGGEGPISKIKATRYTGTQHVKLPNGDVLADTEQIFVYPDRYRLSMKMPQVSAVTVVTSAAGMVLVNGKEQPLPQQAQQLLRRSLKLTILQVAQHAHDPQYSFTLAGKESLNGIETAVLEVAADGDKVRWNVDPATGRVLRASRTVPRPDGTTAQQVHEFSDWRTVNGITVAFKSTTDGKAEEYRTFEINPVVPPDLFEAAAAKKESLSASESSRAAVSSPTRPGQMLYRDVRKMYEGNRVLVLANPSSMRVLRYLTDWSLAKEKNGRYISKETFGPSGHLDLKHIGELATVVALQLEKNEISPSHRIGPGDDDIVDPYFSLVVRFGDGTLAMCTSYPIMMKQIAIPEQQAAKHEEIIRKAAAAMVGKPVYAAANSHFYHPDLSVVDAMEVVRSGYATHDVERVPDVPLLQPLTVLGATYLKPADAMVLTLRTPSGSNVVSVVTCDGKEDSCYENYGSYLFSQIPSGFTPDEISAIKNQTFFTGMSRKALYMAIGFPDHENDYGKGGYQLVYYDGKLMIYLDKDERIVDSQSFH